MADFSRPVFGKLQFYLKKTKTQLKNPLWQEKLRMAAKNQDGGKCIFYKKMTETPGIRKHSNSFLMNNVEFWSTEHFQPS
jgi:hypothetical protein